MIMNLIKNTSSKKFKQRYLKAGVLSYKQRKKQNNNTMFRSNYNINYSTFKHLLYILNIVLNITSLNKLLINPNFYKFIINILKNFNNIIIYIFNNIY